MKTFVHLFTKREGAIMVFALLIILVGAIVLAGWVHMLATRASFTEFAMDGQKRRIALWNGRALARQYVLENMPSGTVATNSYSLTNGWGGFTLSSGASALLTSDSSPSVVNPFSPLERWGFGTAISGTVSDGTSNQTWNFRVRMRSPLFGGFPFTLHNPSTLVTPPFNVSNTLLWGTSGAYMFTSSTYQASGSRPALHGNGASLSAFPYIPLTSGNVTGFSAYDGYISITPRTSGLNPLVDDPLSTNDGIVITDSGSVRNIQLDLSKLSFSTIPVGNGLLYYEINAQAVPGISSLTLTLIGANDASLPPVHIAHQAGALTLMDVSLQGSNVRRVYLSIVTDSLLTLTAELNASWRLGALFQNSSLTLTSTGTFTCVGGIRTNANIRIIGGSISISADSDSGGLETIADRIAWLEENRAP